MHVSSLGPARIGPTSPESKVPTGPKEVPLPHARDPGIRLPRGEQKVLTGSKIRWNRPIRSTTQASCCGTNSTTVFRGNPEEARRGGPAEACTAL